MLKQTILSIKTALALKEHQADSIPKTYCQAKTIALLYSYSTPETQKIRDAFMAKLVNDQKEVSAMVFVPYEKKITELPCTFFNGKDLSSWGNWNNEQLVVFKGTSFDFLVSLDCKLNQYTQNIFATSKSKCRVGRFETSKSQYFELMIDPGKVNYRAYIDSLYNYLINVRPCGINLEERVLH